MSHKHSGNAILELILFVPVAWLVLVIGTEVGFTILDQALVSESIREAERSVGRGKRSRSTLYLTDSFTTEIDREITEEDAQSIAELIESRLTDRTLFFPSSSPFRISVSVLALEFDQETGILRSLTDAIPPIVRSGKSSLSTLSGSLEFQTRDDFLSIFFADDFIHSSPWARSTTEARFRFRPLTVVFHVDVIVASRSFFPAFAYQTFGHSFFVQQQAVLFDRRS